MVHIESSNVPLAPWMAATMETRESNVLKAMTADPEGGKRSRES